MKHEYRFTNRGVKSVTFQGKLDLPIHRWYRIVNAQPGDSVFDPDLDAARPRPVRGESESIAEFQRLLANPFLAVLCWVAIFSVIRQALRIHSLPLFLAGLGLLFVPIFLVQFHCLDCGATGWLFRSRHHACPAVVARRENPGARRRRVLRVKTQLILWFYALMAVSLLFLVGYLAARAPKTFRGLE